MSLTPSFTESGQSRKQLLAERLGVWDLSQTLFLSIFCRSRDVDNSESAFRKPVENSWYMVRDGWQVVSDR
jgi:hypothetical protein